jgi:hypothetical protein
MRRLSPWLALIAIAALAVPTMAANPKLLTFGTGDVTLTGPDSATIVNLADEYGGVYLNSRSQSAKPLAQVVFSFVSAGDVGGGAPRFSWPVDTDRNGTVDGYAFLDVNNCGGPVVSSDNPACITYFGSEVFPNWAAFATAHPTYRSAPGAIPFIIADVPGSYAVEDIVLR